MADLNSPLVYFPSEVSLVGPDWLLVDPNSKAVKQTKDE
jgi:hypothetical protein